MQSSYDNHSYASYTYSISPTIQIWDASTGHNLYRWVIPSMDICQTVLSPDSRFIAAYCRHDLHILDLSQKRVVQEMNFDSPIRAVTFNANGQLIAVATTYDKITILDTTTARHVSEIEDSADRLAFSPDGRWFVTAALSLSDVDWGGTVAVWRTTDWRKTAELQHEKPVGVIAFSPDSQQLITAESCLGLGLPCQASAYVWEMGTGHEYARMEHRGSISAVAVASDLSHIATSSNDGIARIWEVTVGQTAIRRKHDGIVYATVYDPDGHSIASGGNDGKTLIWDVTSGQVITPLVHDNWVRAIAFSPDRKYLVTGSDDRMLHLWDNQTRQELDKVKIGNWVWSIVFDPQSQWVVVSSGDPQGPGTITIWSIKQNKLKKLTERNWEYLAPALAVTADGDEIIVGDSGGFVTFIMTSNGDAVKSLRQSPAVLGLAISKARNLFASAGGTEGGNGFVQLWDIQSKTPITLLQQTKPVLAVAFDTAGKWLTFGGQDGVVHIAESATGRDIARLAYNAPIRAVSFSPDGAQIAVSSSNQVEILYWWPDPLEEICRRLSRNFTEIEWRTYLGTEPYRPTCSS